MLNITILWDSLYNSRRYEFTFILKSISIAERVDQSYLNFFSSKRFFPGHLYSPMSQWSYVWCLWVWETWAHSSQSWQLHFSLYSKYFHFLKDWAFQTHCLHQINDNLLGGSLKIFPWQISIPIGTQKKVFSWHWENCKNAP